LEVPASNVELRRALRQYLEDLSRSGVEQLPRGPFSERRHQADDATSAEAAVPRENAERLSTSSKPVRQWAAAEVPLPSQALVVGERILRVDPPATPAASVSDTPRASATGDKGAELKVLAQQVGGCTLCPNLVASRTQTVFGVGNPQARLCFFGEAPGADEDRLGEPFVGRAGQLLDRIIEASKMQRSDVYILNTVKCRPENNRTPEPAEVENCRPFFERQLEIIRPEFICCLGLVAARALLGTNLPLGRLRGRLHPWRFAQVLVTYHPAYLLRNPAAKRLTWEDMQLLMHEMGIA
jgi:DNA polymerase